MNKEVMLVTGAGQIGMAIARRTGFGKKIILGDKSIKHAETIAEIMNNAGFDVLPFEMDLSSRESILSMIAKAQEYGEIKYLVNAAGVSPSQAPVETILKVDLYGTAVLLEEVGKVIAEGGAGITVSSQSGWRMPQLTPEEDRALATTPTEELLSLPLLLPLPHPWMSVQLTLQRSLSRQSVFRLHRNPLFQTIALPLKMTTWAETVLRLIPPKAYGTHTRQKVLCRKHSCRQKSKKEHLPSIKAFLSTKNACPSL